MPNYIQGIYEVVNKDKYVGKGNPRYLSSYELKVFQDFDRRKSVIEWGSEVVHIPYYNPVKQRISKYMIDIYVMYVNKEGRVIKELVEIKPLKDTKKPRITKRTKRNTAIYAQATHIVNEAKWAAATKFAEKNGMRFRIITEKNIFV